MSSIKKVGRKKRTAREIKARSTFAGEVAYVAVKKIHNFLDMLNKCNKKKK